MWAHTAIRTLRHITIPAKQLQAVFRVTISLQPPIYPKRNLVHYLAMLVAIVVDVIQCQKTFIGLATTGATPTKHFNRF